MDFSEIGFPGVEIVKEYFACYFFLVCMNWRIDDKYYNEIRRDWSLNIVLTFKDVADIMVRVWRNDLRMVRSRIKSISIKKGEGESNLVLRNGQCPCMWDVLLIVMLSLITYYILGLNSKMQHFIIYMWNNIIILF